MSVNTSAAKEKYTTRADFCWSAGELHPSTAKKRKPVQEKKWKKRQMMKVEMTRNKVIHQRMA